MAGGLQEIVNGQQATPFTCTGCGVQEYSFPFGVPGTMNSECLTHESGVIMRSGFMSPTKESSPK